MNKTELKRLLIYLAFSFGLAYAWFFVTNMKFVKWQDLSNPMQSFIALGMLAPLLSHILTRLVTKEGFKLSGKDSMMLGISFKNGKWIFFLIAILLPWIYLELSNALTILFFRELYDPEYYVSLEIDKRLLNIFPLAAIVSGVFGSFAAFGEEAKKGSYGNGKGENDGPRCIYQLLQQRQGRSRRNLFPAGERGGPLLVRAERHCARGGLGSFHH